MSKSGINFVCGGDDFLVMTQGKIFFDKARESITDDFAVDIIEGRAQNTSEVESIMVRFREAVQTLSLFGEQKVVWLKDVNFLGDTQTGKAASTKALVGEWQELLNSLDSNAVHVIITASPIDRRTKEFKWFQKYCNYHFIDDTKDDAALKALIQSECKKLDVTLADDALMTLGERVNGHSRLMLQEIQKLATYLGISGSEITSQLIMDIVPVFGEGDFFETAEAFYTFNLQDTLQAIRKHFFNSKDSRALLASLQNRNRILIQLRALIDAGRLKIGYRGIDKASFEVAKADYSKAWLGADDKSSLNIFTQNIWYLGKLAEIAKKVTMRKLIDFQLSFKWAFEEVLAHPQEQENVIRTLAIKSLS